MSDFAKMKDSQNEIKKSRGKNKALAAGSEKQVQQMI
jgi:hypothetical protein